MKRNRTQGICAYCKMEIPKNTRSISKHISECNGAGISKTDNPVHHMVLIIEGKYNPDYWLVIKAKSALSMKIIDRFIRDIWVECCGHMSAFSYGHSKIGMSQKIYQAFGRAHKIDYIYDYGSSTELFLSLIGELEENNENDIQVLMRNKEINYKCSYCDSKATAICPFCMHEDQGLLCESCIESHECVINEGDDVLLPLVNSPRAGECGYTGYEEKDVKKYFPNGVI